MSAWGQKRSGLNIVPATFNLVHSGRTVLQGLVLQHPRSEYLVLVLELRQAPLGPDTPLFGTRIPPGTSTQSPNSSISPSTLFDIFDVHCLDAAINATHARLTPDPIDTLVDNHDAHALSTPPPVDALTRCARLLSTRCPACFGGAAFGWSFDEGADIHVALDATFSQRHSMHVDNSPHFYEPEFCIPKAQVDECGWRIIAACKKPLRPSCAPKVPAHIVDECEKLYEAADEKKVKTSANQFDDTGVMALICHHDIPIANVDTPGEQQKYAIVLLEHLFTFLPPNATIVALYDIGCVVDHSLKLYNILPVDIHQQLIFAISAMHAYGHQWACQIVYNPRLCEGLRLTDGEGVERLWARLRKLIPITRLSVRSRYIWLIDCQAKVISLDLRDDLGHWIAQRLCHGVESREVSSLEELVRVGIPKEELQGEWKQQCVAQTSIRAHAPVHLKKELDIVLSLQADLDTVNKAIKTTRTVLENDFGNVSLEFMRLLLMAHDLKINIHKRTVGSFFEWDQLDQAVGGRHNPLGTKIHQQTRKAIVKLSLQLPNWHWRHHPTTLASETVNSALGDPQAYAWPFVIETPLPYIIHQDDTDLYGCLEEEELSYLEAEQHLVEDVFLDDTSGDEGPPEDARSEASVMTITITERPILDENHPVKCTVFVYSSQAERARFHPDRGNFNQRECEIHV
ncbi:predicted protein [Postia placenta Mad-698-R]|nr:predicted protein [Postia placenta Mad-698-R]